MLAALELRRLGRDQPGARRRTVLPPAAARFLRQGLRLRRTPRRTSPARSPPSAAAVEAHGGRIVFTEDITFSSSELINRISTCTTRSARPSSTGCAPRAALPAMLELIEQVRDYRVVLVGDAIIDEYQYVRPMGKAAKENIIATRFQDSEMFRRRRVRRRQPRRLLLQRGRGRDLPRRARQLRRADPQEPDAEREADRARAARRRRPRASAVSSIPRYTAQAVRGLFHQRRAADAGRPGQGRSISSVTRPRECRRRDRHRFRPRPDRAPDGRRAGASAPFLAVNAQTNSAQHGLQPDHQVPRGGLRLHRRARGAARDHRPDSRHRRRSREDMLPARIDCRKIIITHGKHGCVAFDERGGPALRIPRSPARSSTRSAPATRSSRSRRRWCAPAAPSTGSASSATSSAR